MLPDGTVHQTSMADEPGYDLIGLLTGSEGTMALTTKITVRLMRKPEARQNHPGHLQFQPTTPAKP